MADIDIPPMDDESENVASGPPMPPGPPPPPAAAISNDGASGPPAMPPPNPVENEIIEEDDNDNNNNNENEEEYDEEPQQIELIEDGVDDAPKQASPQPNKEESKEEKSNNNELKKPKQKASKKESQSKGLREPWNATESDTSKSCWAEISKKKGATINWYACKQKTKKSTNLVVVGKGNKGINEIKEYLKDRATVIRFILLRVESSDIGNEHSSNRAKFVFFKYYGTKAKRGGLLGKLGKILDKFPVRHLEIGCDESLDKMDAELLGKQFLRVGGAHKPDQYDFGGGVIYKTK